MTSNVQNLSIFFVHLTYIAMRFITRNCTDWEVDTLVCQALPENIVLLKQKPKHLNLKFYSFTVQSYWSCTDFLSCRQGNMQEEPTKSTLAIWQIVLSGLQISLENLLKNVKELPERLYSDLDFYFSLPRILQILKFINWCISFK